MVISDEDEQPIKEEIKQEEEHKIETATNGKVDPPKVHSEPKQVEDTKSSIMKAAESNGNDAFLESLAA
jgi:hypothetical protein